MAEGATSPNLKKGLEGVTQCAVCLETFKDPRTLPCQHVFCAECIRDLIRTATADRRKKFHCPSCRLEIPNHEGDDFFPVAFIMNNLCDLLKSSGEPMCVECSKDGESVLGEWLCAQCAEYMCNRCKRIHDKYNQEHLTVESANITPQVMREMFLSKTQGQCEKHGKELEYICEDCKKLLCVTCKLTDEKHAKHKTLFAKDSSVVQAYKSQIKSFAQDCIPKLHLLETCMSEMKDKRTRYRTDLDCLINKIERRAEDLVCAIEKKKGELTGRILSVKGQYEKDVEEHLSLIHKEHERVQSIEQKMTAMSLSGSPTEVVSAGICLEKDGYILHSTSDIPVPEFAVEVHWDETSEEIVCGFGEVKFRPVVTNFKQFEIGVDAQYSGLVWDADDKFFAAVANSKTIEVHTSTKPLLHSFTTEDLQKSYSIKRYGRKLYVPDYSASTLHIYDVSDGKWQQANISVRNCTDVCVMGDRLLMCSHKREGVIYSAPLDDLGKSTEFVKHPEMKCPAYIAANSTMLVVSCVHLNRGSNNVFCFDSTGQLKFLHGGYPEGCGDDRLNDPRGIAIDQNENIVVCDYENRRVKVFSPTGNLIGCISIDAKPMAIALAQDNKIALSTDIPRTMQLYSYSIGYI